MERRKATQIEGGRRKEEGRVSRKEGEERTKAEVG